MKRARQFAANAGMGYVLVAANIAYTALSIPLALRYMGKEEFGLWSLAQQVAGYFMLLDFGLSSAQSRLLANHKDRVNGSDYSSLLLTGALVFGIQGCLLFAGGTVLALFAPDLFHVPGNLAADFRNVLIILSAVSGATVALRSFTAPLWAFQRLDIVYGFGALTLAGSLAGLWGGFQAGWGIYSLALAGIPPMILCTILGFTLCWREGFYPSRGSWSAPRWRVFREMFSFGKDVMLMSLGSQMVNASQIMILGRFSGLDAAATFAVGTKFYTMGSQLTGRLLDSSAPALTEMFVQGDATRLKRRFSDIFGTSLLLATVGAVVLVIANSRAVSWWTSGVIAWSSHWDLLLGALLLATTCSRCLIGLFGVAGNLRPVRNLYLAEAVMFVVIGVPAAFWFGIPGLLVSSLCSHLLVTLGYSTRVVKSIIEPLQFLRAPVLRAATIFATAGAVGTLSNSYGKHSFFADALCIILLSSVAAATITPRDVINGALANIRSILKRVPK